jgi:DNA mismatch endonuclease (patch repair protein)
MADIVNASTRSMMMSRVRGKDTRQEVEIRKRLFSLGFRYRLNDNKLPGKPDLVLPRYKAVILIHGCYWHAHDCYLFQLPATNKAFWKKKLLGNRQRDEANIEKLNKLGWRILIIWDCASRVVGRNRAAEFDRIATQAAKWLRSGRGNSEIKGGQW